MLGLTPTRDLDAIRNAYRRLAKHYHPDTAATPEASDAQTQRFVQLQHAYQQAMQHALEGPLFQTEASPAPQPTPRSRSYAENPSYALLRQVPWHRWRQGLLGFVLYLLLTASMFWLEGWVPESHPLKFPLTLLHGVLDGILLAIAALALFFWVPGLLYLIVLPFLPKRWIPQTICLLLGIGAGGWFVWEFLPQLMRWESSAELHEFTVAAVVLLGLPFTLWWGAKRVQRSLKKGSHSERPP
jgi:hypothetical protein